MAPLELGQAHLSRRRSLVTLDDAIRLRLMSELFTVADAFKHFDLPRPTVREGWTTNFDGESACYVEQGRYGLPVKKGTWLYAYGVELPELRWGFVPDGKGTAPRDVNDRGIRGGLHAWRDAFGGRREQWEDGGHRGTHHGLSSTTPPAFRDVLLSMARSASRELVGGPA